LTHNGENIKWSEREICVDNSTPLETERNNSTSFEKSSGKITIANNQAI